MIRLLQRRLIIPRGDTGSFSIPVLKNSADNIAVFTIFDGTTKTKMFQKMIQGEGDVLNIAFTHNDTVNLKPGKYVWDIKYYSNPEFIDDELVNGEEVDSYYAGFSLPICEIRETGDAYLVSPDAPNAKLSPSQLEIITSALHSINEAIRKTQENVEHYPEIRDEVWYVWDAELGDYVNTGVSANGIFGNGIASAVLNDDYTLTLNFTDGTSFTSTSIRGEEGNGIDDIVLNNDFTLTITYTNGESYTTPSIRGPVGPTPQFSIGTVQDGAVAAASITGTAENPVLNLTLPNAHVPTQVSQLTNDAGYLTTETDPTVPAWAKAAQKPTYTASEVGAPTVAEMNTAIGTAIGQINSFDMAVVQALPTQNISTHTIYLVPKTGETNDVYDEYVYINNAWEMVGNTQIDLSNYVQKTDYATNSKAGIIKVGSGLYSQGNAIHINAAPERIIKMGTVDTAPIVTSNQHVSAFYGLAKAAGDNTQSQSDNAVGTYTDEAKAAIQQMLDVPSTSDIPDTSVYATKADTVLETTLSLGRKEGTIIGERSIAIGTNLEASGFCSYAEGVNTIASGEYSHAEGNQTIASGDNSHAEGSMTTASGLRSHAEGRQTTSSGSNSHAEGRATQSNGICSHAEGQQTSATAACAHAEGYYTIANAAYSHVEGKYNIEDSIQSWPTWTPNTEYAVEDKVKMLVVDSNNETSFSGYICKIANNDAEFITANWTKITFMNYASIVGNGTADNARSNAYALDWDGNGHYAGDVYVHANADSTGGTKLATIEDIPDAPVQDVQVNGTSVVGNDGVANIPIGSGLTTMINPITNMPTLIVQSANTTRIKGGTESFYPVTPYRQHESVFYGLSKAAGVDLKDETVTLGTYPETSKTAIKAMLGMQDGLKVVRLI